MKITLQRKLERLNTDTEKMYQSIQSLSEDQLQDGRYGWSIVQVFSHLNDAERASLMYMKKKMQAGDKMQNGSVLNAIRMGFTNQVLKSSLKWKAPSYIANPPEYPSDEIKTKWSATRQAIQEYVAEYPEKWSNKLVYKHPIGGRQNLENAIDSFIYHQIHHIHQINRIKKQLGI